MTTIPSYSQNIQEKKHNILELKKEYMKALEHLVKRNKLLAINLLGANFTMIIGAVLLWGNEKKIIGKVGFITTSSFIVLSGIITLILSIRKKLVNKISKKEFQTVTIDDQILNDLPNLELLKKLNKKINS
ncbi:12644_t:CDS:1 [Racocetra fulgida]|uniref:12644_t:CDS:1 n=1 Tax=Racocetra fulgida TaxID=60492 RepID=A0A9N9HT08_9GLOM|nr:12644_t:CDS:1 [Racocetra fulgida]